MDEQSIRKAVRLLDAAQVPSDGRFIYDWETGEIMSIDSLRLGEGFAFFCWSRLRFHYWPEATSGIVNVQRRLWDRHSRDRGVWL